MGKPVEKASGFGECGGMVPTLETDEPARAAWAALKPELEQQFEHLWHMPELAGMEVRSSAALMEWLESPAGIPLKAPW